MPKCSTSESLEIYFVPPCRKVGGWSEPRSGRGVMRNVFDGCVAHDPRPCGATPYCAEGDFSNCYVHFSNQARVRFRLEPFGFTLIFPLLSHRQRFNQRQFRWVDILAVFPSLVQWRVRDCIANNANHDVAFARLQRLDRRVPKP
jgi:hypothetical protein